MRPDQIARLALLAEEIADQLLTDADPKMWVGHGMAQTELSKDERGDAYWCRKVAIQTGSLLGRVLDLTDRQTGNSPNHAVPLPDDDADKEIRRYEKKAKELIDAIQSGSASKR